MAEQTLSSIIAGLRDRTSKQIGRYKNGAFARRCMAVCALVAAADGKVTSDEENSVADAITNLDMLKQFDAQDLEPVFRDYAKKASSSFGKADVKKVVNGATDEAEKRLLIEVGCIIAGSDGNFDEKEKQVMRRVCNDLGIDPNGIDELKVA